MQNRCEREVGGFGLSREAAAALGLEIDDEPSFMKPYQVIGEDAVAKDDARLVVVVERIGRQAAPR